MTQTAVNNSFTGGTLSVERNTAGSTTKASLIHSDNTNTGSKAIIKIETGGASGGDPFISLTNGVSNYSYGLDNSDSDKFIISESTALGTTNSACCDADGIWVYPSNSAFSVNLNGSDALNVTGDATVYTILFSTEIFDIGSDFDTANSKYVCPVDGIYFFCASVGLFGGNNVYLSRVWAGTPGVGSYGFGGTGHDISTYTNQPRMSSIVELDISDEVVCLCADSGASKVSDLSGDATYTFFMGALIG